MSEHAAPHRFRLRVYYEDTDLAGIVYYANYLKFIERARTEALIAAGIDQAALKAETGAVFAVRRVVADYLAPAQFQDELEVTTETRLVRGARAELLQDVSRAGQLLFRAEVTIVCLAGDGRPLRLPRSVVTALGGLGPAGGGP
jgi:acyl-CoA thioester hydrolase